MDSRSLSLLAAVWLFGFASIIRGARAIDTQDGWPVLGTVIVLLLAGVELLVLLWLRQMPLPPGDERRYRLTIALKLAGAASIGLIGFAMAIIVGPWWLSALGAVLSLAGLAVAWPSVADRERHELLYLV
ncbi:MAG: hypothetical protein OER12_00370 [Acidimicrobiia bacterium]|nr:hypothetical protein [Acidimicrobiia bacterium]